MSQLVDLSLPLTHEMPHFPGSPPVSVVDDQRFEETGCRTSLLVFGSHTGTHLDAPAHFVQAGDTVDAVPLERCIGEALVLDLSRKPPGMEITVEDLMAAAAGDEIGEGARLLVRTDWDRQFGAPGYYADYSPIAVDARARPADRASDGVRADPSDAAGGRHRHRGIARQPRNAHSEARLLLGAAAEARRS